MIELSAHELGLLPLVGPHGLISLGDMSGNGQHQGQGVFSGGHGIGTRGIHHKDASLGGFLEIDIFHPNTCPADDPEA